MNPHALSKLTSGRWLATMTACAVWVILTLQGVPSGEVQVGLLTLVLNSYFSKRQDERANP